jgi:Asp-tRNA(Asn)/Glu-tRNA(Gln) amidotransferase A subunit family amidase
VTEDGGVPGEGLTGTADLRPAAPEYAELDAVGIVEAVRARTVGPVELALAALERIESLEPSINACTVVLAETALAEAHAVEREIASGHDGGALAGVPLAIKDVIWVRGVPATMGTRVLADFVPAEDAVAVRRLREAGAIVVAKTTNPPFCDAGYSASELYGVTRNPWRLDRTPGGSSGGSGAVVAAGMTPLALGTDMGGSIRIPAAFCGIAGFKPSHGLVARGPCFEEARTLNAIGPMARTVRDLALCLNVIAGPDPADNLSIADPRCDYREAMAAGDVPGLRVAWSADLGGVDVDAPVRAAFRRATDALEQAGWNLEEACPDLPPTEPVWFAVALGERGSFADGREELIEPGVRPLLAAADKLSAKEYYAAQLARATYARTWGAFFERYDLILTPTVPLAAFGADLPAAQLNGRPIDVDRDVWWELLLPANLIGGPAVSVPMGLSEEGLPFGLQIMGPRFQDARCLAAAAAIEAIMPWPRLPPSGRS